MAAQELEVISIEKATVMKGRLRLDVRVTDGFPAETSADIAQAALRIRPSLQRHACINSCGPTFGAVMAHTSLPHLFEHLVIDEQANMSESGSTTFKGATRWTDHASGRACVEVSFADDIVALEAVTRAQALLRRIFADRFSMLE